MTASESAGRRAQRKRATHRLIHECALRLVAARGRSNVTTEQIAAEAGVSPRTFFNYFPTKEAAILGWQEDFPDQLLATVAAFPAEDTPLEIARKIASWIVSDFQRDGELWRLRRQVVTKEGDLAQLMFQRKFVVEQLLVDAISSRFSLDPTEPYSAFLAGLIMNTVRTSLQQAAQGRSPASVVSYCFAALEAGLPTPE